MAGRPRTPTAIKLLTGNPGKRPLPANEPQPPLGAPRPPVWLSPGARQHWRKIAPLLDSMNVLTLADGAALALLADAMLEYVEARAVVIERGATYESITDRGGRAIKIRPEVDIASDAWKRVRAMLTEFGLTPASRSRVKVAAVEDKTDPFAAFLAEG